MARASSCVKMFKAACSATCNVSGTSMRARHQIVTQSLLHHYKIAKEIQHMTGIKIATLVISLNTRHFSSVRMYTH
jgi:hypothetical protein